MDAGGLDAVFVSNRHDDQNPAREARETLDAILRQASRQTDRAARALTAADIRWLHRKGRKVLRVGMENSSPLEGIRALLRHYFRLGVRQLSSGVLFYEPIGAYFYEATWRRREARLSVG
jgi:microsomal dipeptidase-like Zn-dependent dipeptidase